MSLQLVLLFFVVVSVVAAVIVVAVIIIVRRSSQASAQRIADYRHRGLLPPDGVSPSDAQLRELVSSGEKILAIKIYRDAHPGVGLAEAKAAVEKFVA